MIDPALFVLQREGAVMRIMASDVPADARVCQSYVCESDGMIAVVVESEQFSDCMYGERLPVINGPTFQSIEDQR